MTTTSSSTCRASSPWSGATASTSRIRSRTATRRPPKACSSSAGRRPSRPSARQWPVTGRVEEFRPGGATTDNLTTSEITDAVVTAVGTGTIAPTTVGLGGRIAPIFVIDNDSVGGTPENPATPFDPHQDGIDFHESLEGMLVRHPQPARRRPDERLRGAAGRARLRAARLPAHPARRRVRPVRTTSTPSGSSSTTRSASRCRTRRVRRPAQHRRGGRRLRLRQLQVPGDGRADRAQTATSSARSRSRRRRTSWRSPR